MTDLTWRFDEGTLEWVTDNGWRLDEYPVEPDDHREWDIHLSHHGAGPGTKAFAQRLQNAIDGRSIVLTKESLDWEQPDSQGGTYSTSSIDKSPHGRIPYVVEKRHDGFSLSVNLLIRGLDTPECARDIAESIQGTVDSGRDADADAFDRRSIVLTDESLERIVTDVIDAEFWDTRDTITSGVRKLQAAILARQGH